MDKNRDKKIEFQFRGKSDQPGVTSSPRRSRSSGTLFLDETVRIDPSADPIVGKEIRPPQVSTKCFTHLHKFFQFEKLHLLTDPTGLNSFLVAGRTFYKIFCN